MEEKLIKSKSRVQKHGEVFTPQWMVEKMLEHKEIKDLCNDLFSTFLEPAVGEGVFLAAILKKKLKMVEETYANSLIQYENFSLFALTTIYGIEILEDNAQMCVMNLYEVFLESYTKIAKTFSKKTKKNVLSSAKVLIKSNIMHGNFLTKKTFNNKPIVITEWRLANEITTKTKHILIDRTECKLSDINSDKKEDSGNVIKGIQIHKQLNMFEDFSILTAENKNRNTKIAPLIYKYTTVKITDLYKEEIEYS